MGVWNIADRDAQGVAICIILGVALTVVIAWGTAAFETLKRIEIAARMEAGVVDAISLKPLSIGELRWTAPAAKDWPRPDFQTSAHGRGVEWRMTGTVSGSEFEEERILCGWPFRAFVWYEATESTRGKTRILFRDGLPCVKLPASMGWLVDFVSTGAAADRRLPLIPVWSGAVADTSLYAIAFALVTTFVRVIRRRYRRNHGLCPKCGYHLTGNSAMGCPECGPHEASKR